MYIYVYNIYIYIYIYIYICIAEAVVQRCSVKKVFLVMFIMKIEPKFNSFHINIPLL